MSNNSRNIFLSVVGVATLLVAIAGATFAWFSSTMTNGSVGKNVSTVTVGNINMTNTLINLTGILPGAETGEKTFTVSGSPSAGVNIAYKCYIKYSGSVTDLQYKVTGADNSTYGSWTNITTSNAQIGSGTISSTNTSDAYKINVRMRETGTNQNSQQGTSSTVTVSCSVDGTTRYYTNGVTSGTTATPSTQS